MIFFFKANLMNSLKLDSRWTSVINILILLKKTDNEMYKKVNDLQYFPVLHASRDRQCNYAVSEPVKAARPDNRKTDIAR